jgi:hypothetical protein
MSLQILCPVCRTNAVAAPSWAFTDTSVEVPACDSHDGIVSVTLKVSGLIDLEIPTYRVRHSEGLVTF